ncbi:hypothetical protein MSG28_002232 [Choristoneura fumiferana]|uniref:Uncharacterized protein n=3 Tax=Choristoneura fumiferana TaxID=7141 RepID=A0ACC0JUK9_CHOFU|nr:hypothetical protein MSG28_002232 [Choristoneura fumiferana]KAI8427857.1 hypothetical protein MSG28_002232 [Choristoneura fumiferana]KAI8427858.1 hypothetical protein MSG28_002232 [Choristoneura fumiferana]
MDTKGSQNPSTVNLCKLPLSEADEGVVYIAIKGSLHAYDCSVFGLGQEEISALSKKYPGSGILIPGNGVTMKANVLRAINSLAQLGYKIVSSTAFNGEKDKIITLIDKAKNAKEFVNMPDNSGYTALHYAARNGHIDICKTLIQVGANVNAQTSGLATPLHKAAAAAK